MVLSVHVLVGPMLQVSALEEKTGNRGVMVVPRSVTLLYRSPLPGGRIVEDEPECVAESLHLRGKVAVALERRPIYLQLRNSVPIEQKKVVY